jgi:hypothetical protein
VLDEAPIGSGPTSATAPGNRTVVSVSLQVCLWRIPAASGEFIIMPITRRAALNGLGASGVASVLSTSAVAGQAAALRVAGRPVEVAITPIDRQIVRVSVVPLEEGRPQPIPSDGSLARQDWGSPRTLIPSEPSEGAKAHAAQSGRLETGTSISFSDSSSRRPNASA